MSKELLINRPKNRTMVQRWFFGVLTIIAWVGWGALWLPLWEWLRQYLNEYVHHAPNASWAHQTVHLGSLFLVLAIAMGAGLVLACWASYNYYRFAGLTRRKGRNIELTVACEAQRLETTEPVGAALRDHRKTVVHFSDAGIAEHADGEFPAPPPKPEA